MHGVGFFCHALLAHKLLNEKILFETFCIWLYYFGCVKPHRFWYDMWKNSKKNFILDPWLPLILNLVQGGFEVFWVARGICPPPKTCFSHPTHFETSGFNLNCLFIPLKIEYLTPIKWYILKFNFWHNKPYWFLCNLKRNL